MSTCIYFLTDAHWICLQKTVFNGFFFFVLSGSELKDPCEVNLCSHNLHRCEVQNGTATCVCRTGCTQEFNPVCASDNNTYPNLCAMEVASCESEEHLRVVRPGKCGKFESLRLNS